jgi:hypothetical protein
MPVTRSILKNVRQQAVVKFIGGGTANIDLRADLTQPEETFQGFGNTNVTIKTVMYSTTDSASSPILIQRGVNATVATNVMILYGTADWELDQGAGFVDDTGANSNVTVILPASGATLYLVLGKTSGYIGPDLQTAPN